MEKPQYTAAHLKGMNRHVVYDFIRERGATSKAQIVKETGISPPTVIKICLLYTSPSPRDCS